MEWISALIASAVTGAVTYSVGVSRSAIHRWETGRRFHSHKFLLKLSEIYGIEIT